VDELKEQSDAWLMGAIVNGEAEAVRLLVERYRRPLRALLVRTLGSDPDIDDVAQETWMRVVRSAHRYDPEQRFSGWLFGIAWNLTRDRWTRRQREGADELVEVASHRRSAEDELLASERSRQLRDHVERLPERLAQAVLLRYFEELSEREVAERLGIPLGTVKSRLHHGLRKLADSIAGGQ
jgi:RNA polymerase sigma-70 factor (ECF subfamily)